MATRENAVLLVPVISALLGVLVGFVLGFFLRGDEPLISMLHGSNFSLDINVADAVTLSTIIGFGFTILLFLWRLYKDFVELNGRVSKLEGRSDEDDRQQQLRIMTALGANEKTNE